MGIMPGGAHYAQTLGVPPLPLLLLGLMVALCPDIRCSCSALMESQQTFWSRHFLSTDIMSRIAWKVGEVVIILLINPINVINGTRLKPAYGWQGMGGGIAWDEATVQAIHFGVFSTSQRSAQVRYCKVERC